MGASMDGWIVESLNWIRSDRVNLKVPCANGAISAFDVEVDSFESDDNDRR